MNTEQAYKESSALLEGHFKLSSGKHSRFYLQSAKVLENPSTAKLFAEKLAKQIKMANIKVDAICSPALGGLIAGFALATALNVRFIFAERVDGVMRIRRGFEVKTNENYIICEDIVTTGGSALEAAKEIENGGGKIVAFAALANRGFCSRVGTNNKPNKTCKLPKGAKLFALDDFTFEVYEPNDCPLCKDGSIAYKPGSRGN
ncbi:Orotate phosphoribosyltransferase [hydrothermal vent metagenome]|uniref:orotate phosphoribosyltransferase n=1 Tax=hydrothermal vent metagenome TaxID=652676 RepID=A0A3B1E682_9ZZZZ